jgi:hypothetical protein
MHLEKPFLKLRSFVGGDLFARDHPISAGSFIEVDSQMRVGDSSRSNRLLSASMLGIFLAFQLGHKWMQKTHFWRSGQKKRLLCA